MNFAFNEEQKSLGETLGQLLSDFPQLTAPDPAEGRPTDLWSALSELGLFSLLVPEEDGGVGLSFVDVALAIEALGSGLAPSIVASTLVATDIIALYGNENQKARWLPRITEGEMKIAIASLEAGQGYDPEDVQTVIGGNGITGRKILVGDADRADAFLVLARCDGSPCLAMIARDARGVALRQHEDIDPSSGFFELILDAASVADDALISHKAPEAAIARLIDVAATVYAGMQIGIAARMLDTTVEYVKTRVQFSQPIGAFQALKHRCADMAVAIEAGRSAAYYAFWAVAEDAQDRSRAASMAKAYCGETARDVCNQAIQLHGGMGFTWELGLHRFLRRAKVLEHGFGNHVWHYERVMATSLAAQMALHEPQPALVN
ncbi:acyl-CoA dehydrogenase domain-containing protein [Novosphingobium sp. Rr 2-17]|uniref:acyl-CoA dehydrogenase family protein n=1 Tax=Novosphingobium sp. Rr 2-17 TaxID=555793 RepID=UPI000269ABA0|nr:acyl-CoA dehydrogenase family protein [Novosphingobium sp. Rr 2-17]EIZ77827.1 acyl-CoA dehydrogenase domain-containing protein [Novosphingobium sp. Rr 2-17]